MNNSSLKSFSTKKLVDELKTREGVNNFNIAPYARYQIINEGTLTDDTGPATLLIVID